MGRGRIYHNGPETTSIDFTRTVAKALDPDDVLGLNSISKENWGWQHKFFGISRIEPTLDIVKKCMEDLGFKNTLYPNHNVINKFELVSTDTKYLTSLQYCKDNILNLIINNSNTSAFIAILVIIGTILTMLYLLSFFLSVTSKDFEKLSAYECGFEPIHSNARIKFDIIYWIIGILYLIFDLELIFIFPFATILHNLNNPIALLVYLIFIIVLTLGFVYEWKKGALKL